MGVVAEGVETHEQLSMLRDLRCQRVQGYFFSRPLTAMDAELLISKGPAWVESIKGKNGNGH
jgi:EAL domain-containing protein (putative c-di-GMP-specific phosphodiesterase class I)